jgi:hypothetical protein
MHKHQHPRRITDANAPSNAQNQDLRRARQRSSRARVEARETVLERAKKRTRLEGEGWCVRELVQRVEEEVRA